MFNKEMAFKKIINDPYQVVDEMVEGIVLAHSDLLKFANNNKRAVVRKDAPVKDKVGVLIGGGSGHEPAFLGYVGKGLADGAAIGNVFASPSPDPIVDAGSCPEPPPINTPTLSLMGASFLTTALLLLFANFNKSL